MNHPGGRRREFLAEGSLKEVGALEKALGIHDLAKFTPR